MFLEIEWILYLCYDILTIVNKNTIKGGDGMTDNELLLAISDMMDKKLKSELQPIKNDLQTVKDEASQIKLYQENVILPRLNTIESCYTDTYNRYKDYADKMDAAFADIELLKKVVAEHSEKLQKLA